MAAATPVNHGDLIERCNSSYKSGKNRVYPSDWLCGTQTCDGVTPEQLNGSYIVSNFDKMFITNPGQQGDRRYGGDGDDDCISPNRNVNPYFSHAKPVSTYTVQPPIVYNKKAVFNARTGYNTDDDGNQDDAKNPGCAVSHYKTNLASPEVLDAYEPLRKSVHGNITKSFGAATGKLDMSKDEDFEKIIKCCNGGSKEDPLKCGSYYNDGQNKADPHCYEDICEKDIMEYCFAEGKEKSLFTHGSPCNNYFTTNQQRITSNIVHKLQEKCQKGLPRDEEHAKSISFWKDSKKNLNNESQSVKLPKYFKDAEVTQDEYESICGCHWPDNFYKIGIGTIYKDMGLGKKSVAEVLQQRRQCIGGCKASKFREIDPDQKPCPSINLQVCNASVVNNIKNSKIGNLNTNIDMDCSQSSKDSTKKKIKKKRRKQRRILKR